MKRLAAGLLLVSLATISYSQDQKIITVLDFVTSGVSEGEMRIFCEGSVEVCQRLLVIP